MGGPGAATLRNAPSEDRPRNGLPRRFRLRRTADFRQVQGKGRRRVSPNLVVVWREHEGSARFGLAVSRKVGNAVVRNRVKRWLREAIGRQRHGLTGVDVVFIARTGSARAGYAALHDEVGRHLRALKKDHSS